MRARLEEATGFLRRRMRKQARRMNVDVHTHTLRIPLCRLKSILKEVNGALNEQATGAAEKRRQRILRRLLATKRLGRGKFEEQPEPCLLPTELPDTLRAVRAQGSALKGLYSFDRILLFIQSTSRTCQQYAEAQSCPTTIVCETKAAQEQPQIQSIREAQCSHLHRRQIWTAMSA